MRKTIKIAEMAEQLGVGVDTIYCLLQRGDIPHIRVKAKAGSPYIVARAAFDRWLESGGQQKATVQ